MVEGLTATAPYQGFGASQTVRFAQSEPLGLRKANRRFARGRETTCTQPVRLKIHGDDRAAAQGSCLVLPKRIRRAIPQLIREASSERSEFVPRPDARNPGDSSGEATPVPIPNTEVKLSSAEDTERAAFRENRSSPGFLR